MNDLDAFEERASIIEFDDGASRFEAETLAARAQGYQRWEVVHEIRRRNSTDARHLRAQMDGHHFDDLPEMQSIPEEEAGAMSQRHLQA